LPGTQKLPVSNARPAHGRLSQLDGLRAVAILMVIAQHGDLLALGWAGVHLFFVLSGFLITGILRGTRHEESFWMPFYTKRATRIFPPLIPFFVFCALTVSIKWKTTGLAYIFFGANIVQSLPHAQINELTVLWSLAVEEHFYLLWPFAIRFMNRRSLLVLLMSVLVLEPVARAWATHLVASWLPIYFLTCFQLDGLAAGSLLALVAESKACRAWLIRYAGALAIGAGLTFAVCTRYSAFQREQNSVFFNSVGYSLVVLVFSCSLAYVFLRPESVLSRILSLRPVVFLGMVSYGLYLYGGPVIHTVERFAPKHALHQGRINMLALGIGLAVAIFVSWISFRYYETPIVRWGRRRASILSGRHRQTNILKEAPSRS
jgi:peptidoglycan/LPS O-acetylase OafA/YrhL